MDKYFWNKLRTQENGQSVMELALVLPLFLGFVMASITTSLVIYSYILIVSGANQGARIAALEYGTNAVNARGKTIQAVEKVIRGGLNPGTYQILVEEEGEFISVRVQHNFKVNLPFAEKLLESGSIPIKYRATYKLEK